MVHARTPGCYDVITFDEHLPGAGESLGIAHFGFRLVSPRTSTRRSPKLSALAANCYGEANSVPAIPTLTLTIQMATKLKSACRRLCQTGRWPAGRCRTRSVAVVKASQPALESRKAPYSFYVDSRGCSIWIREHLERVPATSPASLPCTSVLREASIG